ncbi:MAG: UDP binding domain-containing protein, partial [Acetobacteraceae bacterium]
IAQATDAVNRRQVERVVALVRASRPPEASVAVLGMAYKPGTPVIEQSQGVMIAERLTEAGYRVLLSDPLALEHTAAALGEGAVAVSDPASAIARADVVVIAAPMPAYAALRAEHFATRGARKTVIDCWRILDSGIADVAQVTAIGRAPASRGSPESGHRGAEGPVRLRAGLG